MGVQRNGDGSTVQRTLHGAANGAITNTGSLTVASTDITNVSAFANLFEQFTAANKQVAHVRITSSGDACIRFNATTGNNQTFQLSATKSIDLPLQVDKIFYGSTGTPTLEVILY
jgi:hypothetical protein